VRAYTSLRDVHGRGQAPAPQGGADTAPASARMADASPSKVTRAPSRSLPPAPPQTEGDAMAIFRLSATVVKRAAGRSIVAAAAYRSGTLLQDERLGLTADYTRRKSVLHEDILAPDDAPAWMRDRAKLWNGVETSEKRKDAQLAREVQVALPHELNREQWVELLHHFVREEFVSRGMVADVAIHGPDRQADERNFHAHITLTMREIEGDHFGKKCRDWNDTELLTHWRQDWAERVNRALEQNGHEARIDHRSLEAQGIDREAQPKLGAVATELERRGVQTDRGDELRGVLARNAERDTHEAAAAELKIGTKDEPAPRASIDSVAREDDGPGHFSSFPTDRRDERRGLDACRADWAAHGLDAPEAASVDAKEELAPREAIHDLAQKAEATEHADKGADDNHVLRRDGGDMAGGVIGSVFSKLADMAEGIMAPPSPAQQVVAKHVAAAKHEADKEAQFIAAEPMAAPEAERQADAMPRLSPQEEEKIAEEVRELMAKRHSPEHTHTKHRRRGR